MCKHCESEAISLLIGILPTYTLMQAKKSIEGWPAGYYGLGRMTDPDFIFPAPLVADPFGNGEPTSDDWTPEQNAQYTASVEYARQVESAFNTDPMKGYNFVNACMKRGYKETDGNVVRWFINYAAELLKNEYLFKTE